MLNFKNTVMAFRASGFNFEEFKSGEVARMGPELLIRDRGKPINLHRYSQW
jgi:hypothetical protein